jgi:predicted  nucleic acid-binding Zn-ribbon protein
MPHQCTSCQSTFPDGSKEMLSGCPDCGGNTFQYIPEGADPKEYEPEPTEPPEPPVSEDSVTGRMGRAASTVREYVSAHQDKGETTDDTPTELEAERSEQSAETDSSEQQTVETGSTDTESLEDRAQASARGEVADVSDLHSGGSTTGTPPTDSERQPAKSEPKTQTGSTGSSRDSTEPPKEDGRVAEEPNEAANTDLESLRSELNDQFESIRIVEPGQYELNLMELYDREEHIVALREDGKYMIEVPETWRDGADGPDRS